MARGLGFVTCPMVRRRLSCAVHRRSDFVAAPFRRCIGTTGRSKDQFSCTVTGSDQDELALFQSFVDNKTKTIDLRQLLEAVQHTGIRLTDPRLSGFISKISEEQSSLCGLSMPNGAPAASSVSKALPLASFRELLLAEEEHQLGQDRSLLAQALSNDLIIPDFPTFSDQLQVIFERCRSNKAGKNATYIPQLARYSPEFWAMSVCTVDGQRCSQGDVHETFTLQSCSKPFTYAICLNELGQEVVHRYIGQEPSGRNFNEICLDVTNRPHNPMLNAGAIMSCSLILQLIQPKMGLAEKYDYLLQYMTRIAGGEQIGFNNSVFLSERQTADRNFAMAYYMRENRCYPAGAELADCLDLYFQTCSLEVCTEALSVMAATLANGGICPTTGVRVLSADAVRDVLSLMYSCGMYNYSGQFAFKVGLPAKSGVSGSVVVVVPNVMGVALWSPPLDNIGNSCRGLQFCEELVGLYNFHRFDNLRHSERKTDPRKRPATAAAASDGSTKRSSGEEVLRAAMANDVAGLRRHQLQGADMNYRNYDGRTALHLASAEGHLETVEFLLDSCQVSLMQEDRWGHTPLSDAKQFGHDAVVQLLHHHQETATTPTTLD